MVTKRTSVVIDDEVKPIDGYPKPKKGYVLMLDILGFREFVTKNNEKTFLKIWSSLNDRLNDIKNAIAKATKEDVILDVLCLSDTIIVCLSLKNPKSKQNPRNLLSFLSLVIDNFFWEFMNKHNIFFRGAISYGSFTFSGSHSMVMGDAIDEVSNWYESTNWIGIILTPSAQCAYEYMIETNDSVTPRSLAIMKKKFVEWKIPMKDGYPKICKYAYYWLDQEEKSNNAPQNIGDVLKLFSNLKHEPFYAEKYSNAIEFIRSCKPKTDANTTAMQ